MECVKLLMDLLGQQLAWQRLLLVARHLAIVTISYLRVKGQTGSTARCGVTIEGGGSTMQMPGYA